MEVPLNHAHTGGSRSRTFLFLLLMATFALGICATSLATGKKTSGVVYASANHAEGSDLYVSGDFNDKVLGRGAIVYVTRVSGTDQPGTVHVTAHKITLYTTKGSLSGPGAADQTFNPDGTG